MKKYGVRFQPVAWGLIQEIPPDHAATLQRARAEAEQRLKRGAKQVTICRSRAMLAGVESFRHFCMEPEDIAWVGRIGGSVEVVEII